MTAPIDAANQPSSANSLAEAGNRCCIVGGGPAGVVLGLLLARAGIPVIVLEKHADFFRDFRGDTVHPSTLQILHELGLLERFLARPHQQYRNISARIGEHEVVVADFTGLPTAAKFLVVMPQWDFLDFLVTEARRYPSFSIRMNSEVTGLIEEDGVVRGVRIGGVAGQTDIRARLVVGADGRGSTVRALSGLAVTELGAPIDVLWFSVPRQKDDSEQPLGRFLDGRIWILINRGDYYQCGLVVRKGTFEALKAAGVDSFRRLLGDSIPLLRERTGELASWHDVKLLTVRIDRLRTWYRPGLLCIGDAAHAMSPIGGVGINLAVQDAVATANVLSEPLARHELVSSALLARIQQRRTFPTWATQRAQVVLQKIILRALSRPSSAALPLAFRLLNRFPRLRHLSARLVGLGVRPEHVRSRVEATAQAMESTT